MFDLGRSLCGMGGSGTLKALIIPRLPFGAS